MQNKRGCAALCAAFVAAMFVFGVAAHGQNTAGESKATPLQHEPNQTQTFFLKNIAGQNDLNDIQTDLRNALPRMKIYGVSMQNALTVTSTAEDIQQAQTIINELDKPRKTYRVTYTVTDSENGKRVGAQRYSLVVMAGDSTELKNGTRVPIIVGKSKGESSAAQVEYIDVGLNIRATISGSGLKTRFERTNVSDQQSSAGNQDPVIHQDRVEAAVPFMPGKPILLGSLEVPGSTRHEDVEAVVELLQ